MSNESLWKDIPIPNYENYQAHPDGGIRNKKTKRLRNDECKNHEYISIKINKTTMVKHMLVASTFCENPNNLEQVNHIDGNKRNNKSSNLEWISASDNIKDALTKRGRKKAIDNALRTQIKIIYKNGEIKHYNSISDAQKGLSLPHRCISNCIHRNKGYYYGANTGPKKKKVWIWRVETIINSQNVDIIEKNITIEGYTHLIACSDGSILNKKRNKVGSINGVYLRTRSSNNINSTSLHRLIAATFIPNPENKPYVNHIDGNKQNNAVTNLEWVTQSENMQHAIKTGLINSETNKIKSDKTKVPIYQLELDGSIIKKWDGACDITIPSICYHEVEICECVNNINVSHISKVCRSYSKNDSRIHHGYGWCFVSHYKEAKINKSLSTLFPEITDFKNVDFDILRKYVTINSRPLWQLDLDGTRVKLWKNTNDIEKHVPNTNCGNLCSSINSKKLCGGYFWEKASYEDIINPTRQYTKIIPDIVKNRLKLDDNVNIKPEIITLLRENISCDRFTLNVRPIVQLTTLDNIIVKYWSGPAFAQKQLGYGRNGIESCLNGKQNSSNGFKWRYLTTEEIIE